MAITIAPSDEACQAIVQRINSGSGLGVDAYELPVPAEYFYRQIPQDITRLADLKVDVLHVAGQDKQDTLDVECRTTHTLQIWIRKKLEGEIATADIATINLTARQIWRRVNEYRTARVSVWDCGVEEDASPDPRSITQAGVYSAMIPLRVEVEASP